MDGLQKGRILIIAEAATNHGGDIRLAAEMVWAAREAGADYIKFQSWQIKNMSPTNPAYEAMKPKELSDEDHYRLLEECRKAGIGFLTSCFDVARVDFLAKIDNAMIKVPSTDVGSATLLRRVRERFKYVILSTGMSFPREVEAAAAILGSGPFCLMHCVSVYPAPPEQANLARINWLRRFSRDIGYSDHTEGTVACKVAAAMGVCMIEKHFTLRRDPANVFSRVAAMPAELREIAQFCRECEVLLGQENPGLSEEEKKSRQMFIGRWGDNR
ncbi:MAG TPA: N-acetylneuraminate synthase family protein [Candidatus Omnitrophota bacterium]|nr:N-acetylneuraminate synthase family protein [Candidatus Omnitrophota bacterium]HRZ15292.1 N-acetylneuraminate synthase family protein [Candidatus Omnitrophota bacterium]